MSFELPPITHAQAIARKTQAGRSASCEPTILYHPYIPSPHSTLSGASSSSSSFEIPDFNNTEASTSTSPILPALTHIKEEYDSYAESVATDVMGKGKERWRSSPKRRSDVAALIVQSCFSIVQPLLP